MGRRNRSPEEQERRAKIRELLQLSSISSMDLITCLQQISIGILDSIIRSAHLSALANHPLFTPTLEVFLPHTCTTS